MEKRLLVPAVALGAVAIPALALAAGSGMSPVVSAKLTGKQEVPNAGSAAGSGIVILHLDARKGTVQWDFKKVKGIGKAAAAHIHKGRKGKAGPVVVPFSKAYRPSGTIRSQTSVIEAIETRPNDYYVNVHTAKYPDGAIRGQLAAGMLGG